MRRVWATLLLVLFNFSLISPAVLRTDTESSLPACCRRDGRHGCGIPGHQGKPAPGTLVQPARCAYFPFAQVGPVETSLLALNPSSRTFAGLVVSASAVHPYTEIFRPVAPSRIYQKRGPPSLS